MFRRTHKRDCRIFDVEFGQILLVVFLVLVVAAFVKTRRRRGSFGHPGPGAAGAVYDLLNQDRRNAIEIIVEEKAEERDPETADGNLPELSGKGSEPRRRR
jgi:hypothetical protein